MRKEELYNLQITENAMKSHVARIQTFGLKTKTEEICWGNLV